MVQKTAANGITPGRTPPPRSTAARQRVRKADAVDGVAVRRSTESRSTEIRPRRAALANAARQLKSPKVFVPLAIALGIGAAAVARLAGRSSGRRALPRLARDMTPRFNDALHTLAELGRELRARIR